MVDPECEQLRRGRTWDPCYPPILRVLIVAHRRVNRRLTGLHRTLCMSLAYWLYVLYQQKKTRLTKACTQEVQIEPCVERCRLNDLLSNHPSE